MSRSKSLRIEVIVYLCLTIFLLRGFSLSASDIYPSSPDASGAIQFDGRGFLINGERTWIASGSLHFARVPRDLWRDRLMKMKRAGLNTVQTYIFWNYHEEREGEFNFSGERDLGAFLDLVHELGMYATVRVGPYACAEWESGGYPVWLRNKPGLEVRLNNPVFLKAVDNWYNHVLPIVASRQIYRGGAVIFVQLENEYNLGNWGVDNANPYLQHLLANARANGIEVPTFFSGLHHASDPSPKRPEIAAQRSSPWYSTEFWTVWYDTYGELQQRDNDPKKRTIEFFDRATWRILANGGNGYNYYMFHGGTNLGMWNDDESAASYDYQTDIGEAGDLRKIYYDLRHPIYFARSFQNILEDGEDASAEYKSFTRDLPVTARKSQSGTAIFLDNAANTPARATLVDGASLQVEAGEFVALLRDAKLDDTFTLSSDSRIFAVVRQGKTTTVIAYGLPGENAALTIHASALKADPAWKLNAKDNTATLTAKVPEGETQSFVVTSGDRRLRVLLMTKALTDQTWIVDSQSKNYIAIGPHYLGELNVDGTKVAMTVEERPGASPVSVALWSEAEAPLFLHEPPAKSLPVAPLTNSWLSLPLTAEAAPGFDDSKWLSSATPLQMGADDNPSVFAWYRARFHAAAAGRMWLQIGEISDHAQLWLNGSQVAIPSGLGRDVAAKNNLPWSIPVEVRTGDNLLAIFVSHKGRNKLYNYAGPLTVVDQKGVIGPVTLNPQPLPLLPVDNWTCDISDQNKSIHCPLAGFRYSLLNPGPEGLMQLVHEGSTNYRATLPPLDSSGRVLHIGYLYGHALISLNGQTLKAVDGTGESVDLPIDNAWKSKDANELTISLSKISAVRLVGRVYLTAGTPQIVLNDWRLRGGLHFPPPADTHMESDGSVRLFRSSFDWKPDAGVTTILRFSTNGLSRGFLWLNGHSLGRYPQTIPVDGLYLPECWLKEGKNDLAVLDEGGVKPGDSPLIIEHAASRTTSVLRGELK